MKKALLTISLVLGALGLAGCDDAPVKASYASLCLDQDLAWQRAWILNCIKSNQVKHVTDEDPATVVRSCYDVSKSLCPKVYQVPLSLYNWVPCGPNLPDAQVKACTQAGWRP